jgi:hypothetical protein
MIEVFDALVNLPRVLNLRKVLLLILLLKIEIISAQVNNHTGISLAGTSGLINIPTAEVISDRQVTIGIGYVNRHSAYLEKDRYDNYPFYIAIGYLPRLEFSAGVMFVPGQNSYDGTKTYKDGVVSLQYLLLKEKKFLPSLAIGARDIYSFILLNTTFIVASKTINNHAKSRFRFHLGYGSDIIDHHLGVPKKDRKFPVGHTIVGVFGGFEFQWKQKIAYMLEYDSQKLNSGIRFRLFPFLNLDLDLLSMKNLSGNLNLSFHL